MICCKESQFPQTQGKNPSFRVKSGRGETWVSSALSPLSSGPPFTLLDTQPGREGWLSGAQRGETAAEAPRGHSRLSQHHLLPVWSPRGKSPFAAIKRMQLFPRRAKTKGVCPALALCVCVRTPRIDGRGDNCGITHPDLDFPSPRRALAEQGGPKPLPGRI